MLHRDHRLTAHPDPFSERLLSHLILLEAQPPDVVLNRTVRHLRTPGGSKLTEELDRLGGDQEKQDHLGDQGPDIGAFAPPVREARLGPRGMGTDPGG